MNRTDERLVRPVTDGEVSNPRGPTAGREHERQSRSAVRSAVRSEQKARCRSQEVTSYWYIAGLLAISLFGAFWVIIAMTFAS
jgi:hypothetical protein